MEPRNLVSAICHGALPGPAPERWEEPRTTEARLLDRPTMSVRQLACDPVRNGRTVWGGAGLAPIGICPMAVAVYQGPGRKALWATGQGTGSMRRGPGSGDRRGEARSLQTDVVWLPSFSVAARRCCSVS